MKMQASIIHRHIQKNNGTESYIIYADTLSQASYKDHNYTYHIWENGKDTIVAENVKDYNGSLPENEKFDKNIFFNGL